MLINFILINYCGALDTIDCLKSIFRNVTGSDCCVRVIVIDNASPKNGLDLIYDNYKDYTVLVRTSVETAIKITDTSSLVLIQSNSNGGFGAGNNVGISYLRSKGFNKDDICVLLNNDTELPADFVAKIISYSESISDFKYAFSVKSINYYDKSIDSEGFAYINRLTGRSSHVKKYKYNYLVGSCVILNNIGEIPLFDEGYFLYYEDADYSSLLRKAGYSLMYDGDNHFYHKVNASSKLNPQIESIKKESMIRFMRRNSNRFYNILFILVRISVYMFTMRITEVQNLLREYAKPL